MPKGFRKLLYDWVCLVPDWLAEPGWPDCPDCPGDLFWEPGYAPDVGKAPEFLKLEFGAIGEAVLTFLHKNAGCSDFIHR